MWDANGKRVRGDLYIVSCFNVCTDVFALWCIWMTCDATRYPFIPAHCCCTFYPSIFVSSLLWWTKGSRFCQVLHVFFVLSHFPLCSVGLLLHEDWDLSLQGRVCTGVFVEFLEMFSLIEVFVFLWNWMKTHTVLYLWSGLINSHRLKAAQTEAWAMLFLRNCSVHCNFGFPTIRGWVIPTETLHRM